MKPFCNRHKSIHQNSITLKPITLFFITLIFLILTETTYSQRSRRGTESDTLQIKPDKTEQEKTDTTASDIVIIEQDTIPPHKPLQQHGKITFLPISNIKTISKKELNFINYTSLLDIIYNQAEAYPLSTGIFGNINHFTIFGSMPDDIEFASNGVSFSIISPKFYNPSEFPVEFIENIEFLYGSKAVIFSKNSSSFINLQSIIHNTAIPFTRLWFCESDGRLMSADIIYAQNFFKNWNFSFGVRREGADNRFESTNFDSWNFRALIRWNISEYSNISLSENFSNHKISLNGGIDKIKSVDNLGNQNIYNEIWAKSFYQNVSEQNLRHDVILTYSNILANDSSACFSSNLYFSYNKNILNRSDEIFLNENDSLFKSEFIGTLIGLKVKYEHLAFKNYSQVTGLSFDYLENRNWNELTQNQILTTANYHGELTIFEKLILSGGVKVTFFQNKPYFAFGSMIKYQIGKSIHTGIDISYSEKIDLFETNISKANSLILAFLKFSNTIGNINLDAFYKKIYEQPLYKLLKNNLGKPVHFDIIGKDDIIKYGLNFSIDKNIEINKELFDIGLIFNYINVNFDNQLNFYRNPHTKELVLPLYRGIITVAGNFLSGRSSVNLGFNYLLFTEHTPLYLLQPERIYLYSSDQQEFEPALFGIFLTAKLGNAFVRIKYENILNRNYYLISIYPERGTHLQFSLSWSFFN